MLSREIVKKLRGSLQNQIFGNEKVLVKLNFDAELTYGSIVLLMTLGGALTSVGSILGLAPLLIHGVSLGSAICSLCVIPGVWLLCSSVEEIDNRRPIKRAFGFSWETDSRRRLDQLMNDQYVLRASFAAAFGGHLPIHESPPVKDAGDGGGAANAAG